VNDLGVALLHRGQGLGCSIARQHFAAPSPPIKGHARAKFVGIIDNAPDEHTAIARAIVEYCVMPNERGRLFAQRIVG
jgi:hypothetical protein